MFLRGRTGDHLTFLRGRIGDHCPMFLRGRTGDHHLMFLTNMALAPRLPGIQEETRFQDDRMTGDVGSVLTSCEPVSSKERQDTV